MRWAIGVKDPKLVAFGRREKHKILPLSRDEKVSQIAFQYFIDIFHNNSSKSYSKILKEVESLPIPVFIIHDADQLL